MKPAKIVLTGGPSAGKTTILKALTKEFYPAIATVPETASILYSGGFHRPKLETAKAHTQRAIYFVQIESEAIVQIENPHQTLICDRGTLDGLAYWPYPQNSYFESINSNLQLELERYQWVIHLDSACIEGYDSSNPIRIESPQEAIAINERIKQVWSSHPQRFIIHSTQDFVKKMRLARMIIHKILAGQNYDQIQKNLYRFFEKI